jgi:hypothetical protein
MGRFTSATGSPGASRLLDFRSAAAEYGIGERYLRYLRTSNRLPVVRIEGRVFIERVVLEALVDHGRERKLPAMTDPTLVSPDPTAPDIITIPQAAPRVHLHPDSPRRLLGELP